MCAEFLVYLPPATAVRKGRASDGKAKALWAGCKMRLIVFDQFSYSFSIIFALLNMLFQRVPGPGTSSAEWSWGTPKVS
jgi:hypothetical protein